MKKWLKYLVPGICILVVAITFALLFDMKKQIEEASNKNETIYENVVEENTTNMENLVENNEVANNVVNDENTTVTENTVQSEVTSSDEDRYSENKQQKAIELVKTHWGADNSVYFTNESVRSDEEYVVAVRLKSTTAVQNYFKVNIVTGKVEIEY